MSDTIFRLSKERAVIIGQSIVIAFLGFWMLEEYANNIYLQDYVSSFWAADWWVFPAIVAVVGVIAGVIYFGGIGRASTDEEGDRELKGGKILGKVSQQEMVTSGGVVVMDVCPFCNVPLRVVGEDRYHCRKCRRYFKR